MEKLTIFKTKLNDEETAWLEAKADSELRTPENVLRLLVRQEMATQETAPRRADISDRLSQIRIPDLADTAEPVQVPNKKTMPSARLSDVVEQLSHRGTIDITNEVL